MDGRMEVAYTLTREDWLAANEACMRESPAWPNAVKQYRRAVRRQMLWIAPFMIIGAAFFIGRGESTRGWYLEGAGLGACFAAFLYFALPRVNAVEKTKKRHMEAIARMDLSGHVGAFAVAIDELGVTVREPNRELRLSWQAVAPTAAGEFVLFQQGGSDATIVPFRAFESEAAARRFLEQARAWWQAAQVPHAARLERYLADRSDVACPGCGYDLRGVRGETCPECGRALRLEEFTSRA